MTSKRRLTVLQGKAEIEAVHVISFTEDHGFHAENPDWIIEHEIYASDTCEEDFYKFDHPKNDGKVTIIGTVEFSLKHLQQRIRAENVLADKDPNDVTISIEMKVIDRYLEFSARWESEDGESFVIPGAQKYFSVAAAFKCGVK